MNKKKNSSRPDFKENKIGATMRALQVNKEMEKSYWAGLDAIYTEASKGITGTMVSVAELVSDSNLIDKQTETKAKELALLVSGLAKDMDSFTTELLAIKAQHADKKGEIKTDSDNINSIMIYEQYVDFNNKFVATVTPIVGSITEIVINTINGTSDGVTEAVIIEETKREDM